MSDIPQNIRDEVIARDSSCCRICGRHVAHPGLHHIRYRSEGGPHTVDNLVVVGWYGSHECHLSVAHRNKKLWQPLLQQVITMPGVTAYQLRRWQARGGVSV